MFKFPAMFSSKLPKHETNELKMKISDENCTFLIIRKPSGKFPEYVY